MSLWFPNFQSWLSAVILAFISGLLMSGMYNIVQITSIFALLPLRLDLFVGMLAILSPIATIAFGHHLLCLFVDKISPNSIAPGTQLTKGYWPTLSSWWEGFYGWSVLLLASILCIGFGGLLMPERIYSSASVITMLADLTKLRYLFSPVFIIWVFSSAYLYQFEFVIRRHFAFVKSQDLAANR